MSELLDLLKNDLLYRLQFYSSQGGDLATLIAEVQAGGANSEEKQRGRSRGQPSPWSRLSLYTAIAEAQGILRKQRKPTTYESVAELLNSTYPDKAPPTGNALKQLTRRFGIKWRSVKQIQYW